jgi:hypothetical protein
MRFRLVTAHDQEFTRPHVTVTGESLWAVCSTVNTNFKADFGSELRPRKRTMSGFVDRLAAAPNRGSGAALASSEAGSRLHRLGLVRRNRRRTGTAVGRSVSVDWLKPLGCHLRRQSDVCGRVTGRASLPQPHELEERTAWNAMGFPNL